jgi:hypothetical protein
LKTKTAGTFDEEATNFLNVDLDIFSKSRLEPLVVAFGDAVWVHYVGREGSRYGAHLELGFPRNADTGIKALAALVRQLPTSAWNLWKNAQVKDFNIGIQGGIKPHYCEFPLQLDTLREIVKLGARVVITVYAAEANRLASHTYARGGRGRSGKERGSGRKKKPSLKTRRVRLRTIRRRTSRLI